MNTSTSTGARPGRRLARTLVAGAAGMAMLATAACSTGSSGGSTGATGDPNAGNLTYWFWGESDIPGIDKWMKSRVAEYEKLHPKVHVNVVSQSSDSLIGGFRLAAQSKSGPDIATQWATMPTLTPYWNKAVTPISDLVPKSETSQWLNTSENVADGKVVAMPLYLIGVPLVWNKEMFKQAGLDPEKPPATWDEFMAACAALKAHGFTPIGMGNKDGFFGAWMFSIFAKQALDSIPDLQSAVSDSSTDISKSKVGATLHDLYTAMQEMVKKGYVNPNVSSLDLTQGWQLFPQKKAAMSFTTDGNALTWGKALGAGKVGVAAPPVWGKGKLANTYDTTQSSSEFITSWSKNKAAAAAFLAWLHQPENMKALYAETGAFPADKRFSSSEIKDPLAKQLYDLDTTKESIWLENYLPPEVDSKGDIAAGQMILSGSGSPDDAVALWDRVVKQWRLQQANEFTQYKAWAKANG